MRMKIGMIVSALLAIAMAAPVEEKNADNCKELYEGELIGTFPFSNDVSGMKLSNHTVKAYGGKLLEVKLHGNSHQKSELKVIFSKCNNKHQGIFAVKGEKGKCLQHSPRKGKKEEEVLYVGDCKKKNKGLFYLSGLAHGRGQIGIYRDDGEVFSDALFPDMEGEEGAVVMEKQNIYGHPYGMVLDVEKHLWKK